MRARRGTRAGMVLASAFPALVLLYAALYGAYGTQSPFLPAFLGERGVSAGQIGLVLAAGTVVRLVAGPAAGFIADRFAAARLVLAAAAAVTGAISFAYLGGHGVWGLLAVVVLHSVATAPLAPLADALTLSAIARYRVFAYGWVRGIGSGAFVLATLASGALVGAFGLSSIMVSSGLLFIATAGAALTVPVAASRDAAAFADAGPASASAGSALDGLRVLFGIAPFRRMVAVAALVIGSHALNEAFAVIHWRAAGLAPETIGVLWAEAVAAEVVVFLFAGPPLVDRLGPGRCAMVAAIAGAVRWTVLAEATAVPILAANQLLHGLSFALLHLAGMRVIADVVPERLAASAQTLYGTFGLGLASAALTAISGVLYDAFGASAFLAMAGLCLIAVFFAPAVGRCGDG